MAEKLNVEDIKEFEFYWTPSKLRYDRKEIKDRSKSEYCFVLSKGEITNLKRTQNYSAKGGVVFRAIPDELEKTGIHKGYFSYDLSTLRDTYNTNYFFNISENDIDLDLFKKAIIVSLFDKKQAIKF